MPEGVKKTLNNVTVGEISNIFNELREKGLVFRCTFTQLSKHLLIKFLPVNPFSVDFETLKIAYLENIAFGKKEELDEESKIMTILGNRIKSELENALENENKFHKYICKKYFSLIKEPKDELLENYQQAIIDIKKIDETLIEIKNQLDEIHKRNQAEEIQNEKPILYYYQEHNEQAKTEILHFLKNEINSYSLSNCYDNSLLSSWFQNTPYRYRWNPKLYKPQPPNDLANKFGNLSLPLFNELGIKYNEDKPSFYLFVTQYISDEAVVEKIGDLIYHHHIFDLKKEIIYEALKAYQNGSKIMFANAVPTIIEGILHDLCILIGEKENDLLKEGFQYKLDKLQNIFGWELYYEYYSFRFRLFRNKVAHGRLTKSDVDELADLLLLDLYQICNLVQSDKLPVNHKLFVIDELNKKILKPDFKYLMEYLLFDDIEIPAFYRLDKQIENVEKLVVSDEFWHFLESEIDQEGEPVKHGIFLVLSKISGRKPSDTRCSKLFKKLGIKKLNKEFAHHYLKYLTKDY